MKSLLISSLYFPPQIGGISYYMAGIAKVLGPNEVACLTGVVERKSSASKAIAARTYRRPTACGYASLYQALSWIATMSEIMIRERPSIVQLATVYDGFSGRWLQRWLGLPYIVYALFGHRRAVLHRLARRCPKMAVPT